MTRKRPLLIPRPVTDRSKPLAALDTKHADNLFGVVREMAAQQAEVKQKLRAAIRRQDTVEVYRLAASLCGESYGIAKSH